MYIVQPSSLSELKPPSSSPLQQFITTLHKKTLNCTLWGEILTPLYLCQITNPLQKYDGDAEVNISTGVK